MQFEFNDRAIAKDFFNSEIRDLESATRAATKEAANLLKKNVGKELRKFKKGSGSNGSFQKSIKVYNLRSQGSFGPASFVRLGVPFMDVFQEGATVTGKPNLIILLSGGAKLGFRRVNKGNQWGAIWSLIRDRAKLVKVDDGVVVALQHQGQNIAIYKIQKSVKDPKKISFNETAEQIADRIPEEINKLLEN